MARHRRKEKADKEKPKQINFDKPIVSSYSKPLASKEVVERLFELHNELTALDSLEDTSELKPFIKDFMNAKLIESSNVGVQSLVLCCVTDVLRLFAPNCPFNSTQLTKIFNLVCRNLKSVHKSSNTFHDQQVEYLNNLSTSNSVVLICETENSTELIDTFFQIGFSFDASNSDDDARFLEPIVNCFNSIVASANSLSSKTLNLIFYSPLFDTVNQVNQRFEKIP
ncbi:unnamed protein product [Ambrosiozyma monospora]|uniref:Unnamed protein product n=1 Tax=Ambrosiozyma monospora TaxID=43982 RepID=A0ACB5T6A2_AMBMO|nr:unnamed protein product [Ambrosiozyma monospora]